MNIRLTGIAAVAMAVLAIGCSKDKSPVGNGDCDTCGVVNDSPEASTGGPYTTADGTVHFRGSSILPSDIASPVTFAWDFGDGNGSNLPNPTHTYATTGTYTATLTVTKGGATAATGTSPVTVTTLATEYTLSGAGNIAKCTNNNDDMTSALLDALPGYVFTLGDNAFGATTGGTAEDYANCYNPSWGRQRSRTFPVLGNHEYDPGNADAHFDYFGTKAGPRGQGYYSYNLGNWHVVVLNENIDFAPGSTQLGWLTADLAASNKTCTIAMWHTPLYYSSATGGASSTRKPIWDVLHAAGVDIVVNGQQHNYERLAPMTPTGVRDDAGGIRTFIVGTGGESVSTPAVVHANSEIIGTQFGVLSLKLKANGYDWSFLPVAGASFTDTGSGTCH